MSPTQSEPTDVVPAGYEFEESLSLGGISCKCGWELEDEDLDYEWAAAAYDLHLMEKHDRRLVVPKGCPHCDVVVYQPHGQQVWHWCDDGEKYELTIEHRYNLAEEGEQ